MVGGGGGGVNKCPLTCLRTYKWGQMYTILIFSKYISHKKEIKVNNLTPDYVQNLIYLLVVLKFDPKEPKLFKKKSQNLPKISSKMHFLLHIILSALDNIQKLV